MDTPRRLHLLAAGDLAAWPDLARDLERRGDAENAAEALRLLHAQGHVVEAAQWLARVTDTDTLQTLRASLLTQAEGWQVGPLRALARDLLSGTFRLIPAGMFLMGSPEDEADRDMDEELHVVEITQPFLLKTTPVTQAEWQALMGDDPSFFKGDDRHSFSKRDDRRPVEQVLWEDAVRFCDALSTQTGGAYRLPTEAEWEYACRAGTIGARYDCLDAAAWYLLKADMITHAVGQKRPNAWGLYDMLGNVQEWCYDWYQHDYLTYPDQYRGKPLRDPTGPPSGCFRVTRGGSWIDYDLDCRAARRREGPIEVSRSYIGFRAAGSLR